jgi:hypothetical protein
MQGAWYAALLTIDREVITIIATVLSVVMLAPVLAYAMMWALSAIRRIDAEARIREAEAEIRQCDVELARLRVRAAEHIVQVLEHSNNGSADVLTQELLKQPSPMVADLGNKALVGNIGVTLPKG